MSDSLAPIVITGGARRLGLAAALALGGEGRSVVITYRKHRPLLRDLRQQGIITLHADFATDDGVLRFAEQLHRRFDSLRAIIHNASEWLPEGGLDADRIVMRRMMQIHVTAPYLLNRECGSLLRRYGELHGCADIIHMSDYVAGTGSRKHIAYAASKAALDNLTLSFASDFAPLVKVNSIAPALLMFRQEDDASYREKAAKKSLLVVT
jgi:dihydromonapterin reductase/dihydrofolate reductase